jgi:superfamily II DNA or RNA helicase
MKQLHSWQRDWLRRIERAGRRVLCVGPTGCGKTVMAVALMGRGRILFVAHTRELVTQAATRCREWGLTDVGIIAAGHAGNPRARIQIASKATLEQRTFPAADVVIFDEAHHVPGEGWSRIHEHYDASGARIYGFTATPIRLDGKGLARYFDALVQSPPLSTLAALGRVVLPRIYAPLKGRADLSGVPLRGGDFDPSAMSERLSDREVVGSLVKHWTERAAGRPTVVYAVDTRHGETLARSFRRAGVTARLVTGAMPAHERDALVASFVAGDLTLLVNCQVLTEGWDCPGVRCVVLARPTLSFSLLVQMIGRSTRPSGSVRPIVLDLADNCRYFDARGLNPIGDHQWPLLDDGETMRGNGGAALRACPECEALVPVGARTCEACGHEFPRQTRRTVDAELVEWRPSRSLTEAQITSLVEGYRAGASSATLARSYGIAERTVVMHLHARGVAVRGRSGERGRVDAAQVEAMHAAGKSVRAIASALGVSRATVAAKLGK